MPKRRSRRPAPSFRIARCRRQGVRPSRQREIAADVSARSERQDSVVRHRVFTRHAARAAPGAASGRRANEQSWTSRLAPLSSKLSSFDGKNQGRDHRLGHRRAGRRASCSSDHGDRTARHAGRTLWLEKAVVRDLKKARKLRPAEGRADRQRRRGDQQSARSRSSPN